MKKILAIVLSLVLMLTFFAGCGAKETNTAEDTTHATGAIVPSDEELIKADLEKIYNDAFAAEKVKGVEEYKADPSFAGCDAEALIEAACTHVSMEVTAVNVDGDKATAEVKFTSPEVNSDRANEFAATKMETIKDKMANATEEEETALFEQFFIDLFSDKDFPELEETGTANYEKVNGEWKLADEDFFNGFAFFADENA